VDQIRQQLSCQNSASDQSGDEDLLAILKENKRKTPAEELFTPGKQKQRQKTEIRFSAEVRSRRKKHQNFDYE
jgi:hypothetical protein